MKPNACYSSLPTEREPNEDPYYLHAYRVNFDGTGLKLLNPGEFEHAMSLNDNNSFFIDNYSRVNTVPKSALYAADGLQGDGPGNCRSLFADGYGL